MSQPLEGKLLEVGGRRVHLIDEGSGEPVVLLHGCGSLAQEVHSAFAKRTEGVRLVAIDRPGYGWSDPLPDGEAGPDAQARWLDAILDALGITRCTLVAHSIGTATALCEALDRPDRITGMLLLSPFCRPTPHALMPLLRIAVAPLIGGFLRETVVPAVADRLGPGRLAAALHPNPVPDYLAPFPYGHAAHPTAVLTMATELLAFNAAMSAREEALAGLEVPTLVLHGDRDEIAPVEWHSQWLCDKAPQTVTVEKLSGIGHAPHHVAHAEVMGALRRILSPRAAAPVARALEVAL